MKKYVQEATDENIWTSIKNNTFGRNKDIKDFIDGLELIDESACISLDAKWGDGKTSVSYTHLPPPALHCRKQY